MQKKPDFLKIVSSQNLSSLLSFILKFYNSRKSNSQYYVAKFDCVTTSKTHTNRIHTEAVQGTTLAYAFKTSILAERRVGMRPIPSTIFCAVVVLVQHGV